jgi:hypothetical protein
MISFPQRASWFHRRRFAGPACLIVHIAQFEFGKRSSVSLPPVMDLWEGYGVDILLIIVGRGPPQWSDNSLNLRFFARQLQLGLHIGQHISAERAALGSGSGISPSGLDLAPVAVATSHTERTKHCPPSHGGDDFVGIAAVGEYLPQPLAVGFSGASQAASARASRPRGQKPIFRRSSSAKAPVCRPQFPCARSVRPSRDNLA